MPSRSEEGPAGRTVRQLVEALLYERVVDADIGRDPDERVVSWRLGQTSYRCRAGTGPFGRVRVERGSIEVRAGNGAWGAVELRPLIEAVCEDAPRAARLVEELERTIAFCRWNGANVAPRDRRAMGFAALDRALDEGHPYHPCFKARTGFSEADHRAYGPEAGETFRLIWLAVARDLVHQALPDEEAVFWTAELGAETVAELDRRRAALGPDAARFALVPIHPWQWRAQSGGALAALIAEGRIQCLGEAGDRYAASQSVRTLHNVDHPGKASVKLPLSMSNSTSMRTLEPHSVCVAPALSRWLEQIIASDPVLRDRHRLSILPEYAGVIVDRDGPLGGLVGAIWRSSVEGALEDGERAAPFNALTAVESDGRLFVEDWLARYGAAAWIDRLIAVAVLPVWRLLARHGVATEAHGQNMILVHRDGWPERLVLRDFHDSVEFTSDFLREPALAPDLSAIDPVYREAAANRFHRMDRPEELRALVMDSLFVFGLTELSRALAERGVVTEDVFWARVDALLKADEAEHGGADRLLRLGVRAPSIAVERLLAPKLSGEAVRSVSVPNALTSPTRRSQATMIEVDDRRLDRAAFEAMSGRWTDRLGLGRDAGLRWAVCVPDAAEWLSLLLATRETGTSILPIHPATPYPAARRLATGAGCHRLVFGDRDVEILPDAPPAAPGELLQMSSGTTGAPKCVARAWTDIEPELGSYVAAFPDPDEMTPVVACPTTHSYGLICGVLAGLRRGRAPVVVNVANPRRLLKRLREADRPLLYSSPAVLHTLAQLTPRDEKLHATMTSGTLLPAPWFAEIRARSHRMFQQYGCSEAGCVAVNREVEAANDIGAPLPHLAVSAGAGEAAPREIVVEARGRRIATRDLGFAKADGTLVFVSRLDDTINVSGLNVYPGEVEDVAMAHPMVADAVAFRVADPFAGERVALLVSGPGAIERAAVTEWCRRNLAGHQTPVDVIQVERIPRQANGKISRREVAAMHASGGFARPTIGVAP